MLRSTIGSFWVYLAVWCFLQCAHVWAAPAPVVKFDVARTVACRDVTTDDYRRKYPESSLIEAVIEVSPRLLSGSEKDIKELVIEITSPDDQLLVRGYLPTSQLTCDVVGEQIYLEQTEADGKLSLGYSAVPKGIRAGGEVRANGVVSKTVLTKLAPKSLLLASGTINRAHGVYFKLAPSDRDTIQRSYQFTCLFEAGRSFRADCLLISCRAVGVSRGRLYNSEVDCGTADFLAGIHLDGNESAKRIAGEVSRLYQEMLRELGKCGDSLWDLAETMLRHQKIIINTYAEGLSLMFLFMGCFLRKSDFGSLV